MRKFISLCFLAFGVFACTKPELGAICVPGEYSCNEDTTITVCSADGLEFVEGACSEDSTCVPGVCDDDGENCRDLCLPKICEPGERLCGLTNDTAYLVYICDETGTTAEPCGNCAAEPINGMCFEGQCISTCNVTQKTYIGCEYYAVDLDNAEVFQGFDGFGDPQFLDAQGSQFSVVVSNPDIAESAFVTVTTNVIDAQPPGLACVDSPLTPEVVATRVVPPRGIEIINLPRRDVNGTVKARLAYRVASNIPISAYQFNPLENVDVFSNDASVLLPTNTIGSEYYVMTRGQTFDILKGYFTVVAVNPEPTEVSVTVTAQTLPGVGIPAMLPGQTYTTTLNQFDVLSIQSNAIGADLTGSRVVSSLPVSVFGGSEAANAPSSSLCDLDTMTCKEDSSVSCACETDDGPLCTPDSKCRQFITCCADHLEQQLLPVNTWGSEYVAVASYRRGDELDVWRILAASDGTTVTLSPPVAVVPSLDAGEWFEFESAQDFLIDASKPVMVGQFLAAEFAPLPGIHANDAGIGDPAFIMAVPFRQFLDNYVFLAPNKYERDYISISLPAGAEARLDGDDVFSQPGVLSADIADGAWRAVRLPISDGFHELLCSENCGVMVHGYDSFVSYGYPGGLNLEIGEDEP